MIQDLINSYIREPSSFEINIKLASVYEAMGQLASAVAHYLKAADLAGDEEAKLYIAISGMARSFEKAGGRDGTVESLLKRALTYGPKQADAYLALCNYYERKQQWYDCYMMACIGLENSSTFKYELFFARGVAAWWIGNTEESREIVYCLWSQKDKIEDVGFRALLDRNIYGVGEPYGFTRYRKEMFPALKRSFTDAENIEHNYSQCHQDMFAALVANGKRDGYYLEIGSGDPEHNNNSCMLERHYGWKGISVDISFPCTQRFRAVRENTCIQADATQLDYKATLEKYNAPKVLDYLQIDVDPPQTLSLDVLMKIPFDEYKFRAITFEHNAHETSGIREASREYLKSKNYRLVVSDIAFRDNKGFEDWWVHASVPFASPNVDLATEPKTPRQYFYDEEKFKELQLTGFKQWVTL